MEDSVRPAPGSLSPFDDNRLGQDMRRYILSYVFNSRFLRRACCVCTTWRDDYEELVRADMEKLKRNQRRRKRLVAFLIYESLFSMQYNEEFRCMDLLRIEFFQPENVVRFNRYMLPFNHDKHNFQPSGGPPSSFLLQDEILDSMCADVMKRQIRGVDVSLAFPSSPTRIRIPLMFFWNGEPNGFYVSFVTIEKTLLGNPIFYKLTRLVHILSKG
jgi:hypothetical protein